MHSLLNRASVAPGCVFSLEMPGFLRLVTVGRFSDWVLIELKLPVTPGNHRLECGRCELQWGLKEKQNLSTCTTQSSSGDLYKGDFVFCIPMCSCLEMVAFFGLTLSVGCLVTTGSQGKQCCCRTAKVQMLPL